MTIVTNLAYTPGEDIEFLFHFEEADGSDMDLTDATIEFRISSRDKPGVPGAKQVLATVGAGITVTAPLTGDGFVKVARGDYGDLPRDTYDHECWVQKANGDEVIPSKGALSLGRGLKVTTP